MRSDRISAALLTTTSTSESASLPPTPPRPFQRWVDSWSESAMFCKLRCLLCGSADLMVTTPSLSRSLVHYFRVSVQHCTQRLLPFRHMAVLVVVVLFSAPQIKAISPSPFPSFLPRWQSKSKLCVEEWPFLPPSLPLSSPQSGGNAAVWFLPS